MASPALKVLPGGSTGTPYNRFWDAWEWFRTEKEGDACSPKTLEYYRYQVVPFLEWLEREHPEVLDFPQLSADHLRSYRARLSKRVKRNGGRLDPTSLLTSHKRQGRPFKPYWLQSGPGLRRMPARLDGIQKVRSSKSPRVHQMSFSVCRPITGLAA